MANQSRRNFLKTTALVGITVTGFSSKTKAAPKKYFIPRQNGCIS